MDENTSQLGHSEVQTEAVSIGKGQRKCNSGEEGSVKKKSEWNFELQKWMLFQKIEQKEMIRVKLAGLEQCSLKSDLF